MRISDIPDFPPRAAKALRGVGVETIEEASQFSAASLLALTGIGEKSLQDLTEAGWTEGDDDSLATGQPASGSEAAAELVEKVFAPAGSYLDEQGENLLEKLFALDERAERFFLRLCDNATPSPQLVAAAFDLAVAFEQESDYANGSPVRLEDGLRVRHAGRNWTVRTSFKPGEEKPASMKTVALVAAES